MLYEVAKVREYFKDKKNKKNPYYTIGIKKDNAFYGAKEVLLLDISEEETIKNIEETINAKLEGYEETKKELETLKEDYAKLKKTNQENENKIVELQQDLLKITHEKEDITLDNSSKLEDYISKIEKLTEDKESNLEEYVSKIQTLTEDKNTIHENYVSKLEEKDTKLEEKNDLINKLYVVIGDYRKEGAFTSFFNKLFGKEPNSIKLIPSFNVNEEEVINANED